MTDPPRSRPTTPAPQGEVQMNPHQALQTAINQIAELRAELNETRNLVQTNRHLGNETQLSIEQKLSALLESLKVSADSTHANTTAVTRAVEKVTTTFSRSDHITTHPDGSMSISSGPPPRDPGFRRWNSSKQSITEWLLDVEERASLARLNPQDILAYAKLSLNHLSGHFMALRPDIRDDWEEFKKWLTQTFTLPNAPHFMMRQLQALRMRDNHLLEYINEFNRLLSLTEKATNTSMAEFIKVHFFVDGLEPKYKREVLLKKSETWYQAYQVVWDYHLSNHPDMFRSVSEATPMDLDATNRQRHRPSSSYNPRHSRRSNQFSRSRSRSSSRSRRSFNPPRSQSRSRSRSPRPFLAIQDTPQPAKPFLAIQDTPHIPKGKEQYIPPSSSHDRTSPKKDSKARYPNPQTSKGSKSNRSSSQSSSSSRTNRSKSPRRNDRSRSRSSSRSTQKGMAKCFNCGKPGHFARDCRSKNRQRHPSRSSSEERRRDKRSHRQGKSRRS